MHAVLTSGAGGDSVSSVAPSITPQKKSVADTSVNLAKGKSSLKRKADAITRKPNKRTINPKKVKPADIELPMPSLSSPPPPDVNAPTAKMAVLPTSLSAAWPITIIPSPVPIPKKERVTTESSHTIDLSLEDHEKENNKSLGAIQSNIIMQEKDAVVETVVTCPICSVPIGSTSEAVINQHIDECLSLKFLSEEEQKQAPAPTRSVPPPLDDSFSTEGSYDEEEEEEEDEPPSLRSSGSRMSSGSFSSALNLLPEKVPTPAPPVPTPIKTAITPPTPPVPFEAVSLEDMALNINPKVREMGAALSRLPPGMQPRAVFLPAEPNVLVNAQQPLPQQPLSLQQQEYRFGARNTGSVVLDRKLDDKECSICFEDFNAGAEVRWLECLCVYHTECIREWWKKSGSRTCPMHPDS